MIQKIAGFIGSFVRKYATPLAPVFGCCYSLCLPPFNHEYSIVWSLNPFFAFVALIPLLIFARTTPIRTSLLRCYLYGMGASLVQYYWIAFVSAEGVWHLIIIGVVLLCLLFGLYYVFMGLLFRQLLRWMPRATAIVFPAFWVLIDYLRTLGELSFPWALLGYSFTPLPLGQLACLTGVYGLTFLAIMGNVLVFNVMLAKGTQRGRACVREMVIFSGAIAVLYLVGFIRQTHTPLAGPQKQFSCIQACIDQSHWTNNSLETSFAVVESLVIAAAQLEPDCILTAESSLLCYLDRQTLLRRRILKLSSTIRTPLVVGALHWDASTAPVKQRDFLVYNTAFLIDSGAAELQRYYKMRLVPFSEALPFEGVLPMLSRVNLGEADFEAGKKPVTFRIGQEISGVPLICYEVIYPDFVRRRLNGANVMLNITNDGWFGRSSGPYQHAMMARMRCIENGIALVRCANSGISMMVDPLGRVVAQSKLYERQVVSGRLNLGRVSTWYSCYGDWFVCVCMVFVSAAGVFIFARSISRKRMSLLKK